ncbi:MAG: DUF2062 domain-containing protein [Bacillota bacterium]
MLRELTVKYLRRLKDTYEKVMDLPDSPRKIAQGVALGTALEFLPMPFISIPVSYLLARLVRVNAAAAVLTVIFFKWAVPFFFAFNYYIGKILLGSADLYSFENSVSLTGTEACIEWMRHLGYPFLVGAAINSVLAGVVTYYGVRALLECRRKKRTQRSSKLSCPEEIR